MIGCLDGRSHGVGIVKLAFHELRQPQDMGNEIGSEYSIWRLGISTTSQLDNALDAYPLAQEALHRTWKRPLCVAYWVVPSSDPRSAGPACRAGGAR